MSEVAKVVKGTSTEFSIYHEQGAAILQAQWQPLASVHRAAPALQRLLNMLTEHCVSSWLLDLHHMPDLLLIDQHWLEYYYLPAVAALPLRHLALVLKPHGQHETLLDARENLAPAFEIQVFDDATTALDWLRQMSRTAAATAAPC